MASARKKIETALYDQGCATASTMKAIPFLLEVAAAPPSPGKLPTLELLGDILTEDADWVFLPFRGGPLATAILRGLPLLLALLDAEAVQVRTQAARLVAHARAQRTRVVPRLERRLAVEKDPWALATMLLAAAMLDTKVALDSWSRNADVRVRTAAALATVRRDASAIGDDAVAAALVAALDDPSLLPKKRGRRIGFFDGNLRWGALEAMRRYGRGQAAIVEALIARRQSRQIAREEPRRETIGERAVAALVEFAVPQKGRVGGVEGKRILKAVLDANPGAALVDVGLSPDPVELERKLGASSKRGLGLPKPSTALSSASRLDDIIAIGGKRRRAADSIVEAVSNDKPWAPTALVEALAELPPAARVELVLDLLTGRDKADLAWTEMPGRWKPGQQLRVGDRRRARAIDFAFRLLREAGAAIAEPLDRARASLATRAAAARDAKIFHTRFEKTRGLLALVRATLHAEAGQRVSAALLEEMGKLAVEPDVAPRLSAIAPWLEVDTLARVVGDRTSFYLYADLTASPRLAARIANDEAAFPVADAITRLCEGLTARGERKAADAFARRMAARDATAATTEVKWRAGQGETVCIPAVERFYGLIPKIDHFDPAYR